MTTPISTLQEVQTWLGTLTVGQTTSVGSSLFDSTMVTALFNMLPGSDPISVAVTAIDVTNATLTGTATVLGEAGSTVAFIFTQPKTTDPLLLELDLTLPSSLEWTLLSAWNIGFGGLAAQFVPNEELSVIGLTFDATITAGTSPNILSIPIDLQVPTWQGDWLLQGKFDSIGSLADEALTALMGGNDVIQLLQNAFSLSDLSLSNLEVGFNPTAKTVSLIAIDLSYTPSNWTFFGGAFQVDNLEFDIQLQQPFTSAMSYQGFVQAEMEIPAKSGNKFDVSMQFPDYALVGTIPQGGSINLTDIFEFFQVSLPSNFPNIVLDTLSFNFMIAAKSFSFNIAINTPFPIISGVQLNNFNFNIAVSWATAFTGSGALSTSFTLGSGGTTFQLAGSYTSGGDMSLSGTATNIEIGQIIDDIATQIGIPASSIPAPISNLVIESITTSLNTGTTDSFSFALVGTTTISGVSAKFMPVINATYDTGTKKFTANFTGTLVLTLADSTVLTFTVIFSDTPTDTWIQTTFTDSAGLTFQQIAGLFGFTLPTIPPDLDLSLTGLGLRYDFSTGALAFGITSNTYGNAAFARLPLTTGGTPQNFFLLDTNHTFSLSNLPLVGSTLAQIENIQVEDLTVVIASVTPVTAANATTINAPIQAIAQGLSKTLPTIPATGLTGTFLISANMVFGNDAPTPLSVSLGGTTATNSESTALIATEGAGGGSSSDGVTWFNLQKNFGPVSLQRIGVMYQSDAETLWFEIDATLTFGPMALSLDGLGIGSPLTSFAPQFTLAGLGLQYSNPPLKIGGALVNLAPPGASYIDFEGGVVISTGEFTLQAFGLYSNAPVNGQPLTTMFLFGDLAYPFGGPPAFFVTGVTLGFGYNSNLTLPTIDQVATFPFVQVLPTSTVPNTTLFGGPNATPLDVLNVIVPAWVQPQDGELWFAAGITFTSFELISSQAMIIVQAGNNLVIALVGSSRATFPQGGDPSTAYAYIELDLLVRFAPNEGVFSLQAVLAKSSFLLTQACMLTGGFAFFVWFGPSPHSGDFVITLGGYNPGFTPPAWYPTVPQVGFHWSVDSSITISGGVYFALTPSVLMLGGQLSAVYQSGNLKAWFNAHADVIIRWKPFWFSADIGINIGASYKLDLLFTTCTITVELGVDLELWGPPTGGSIHVDWYIISFTIPFGSSQSSPPGVTWTDVNAMLPQTGSESAPNILSISPVAGLHPTTTAPSSGQTSNPTRLLAATGDAVPAPWIVRGSQFAFTTATPIPSTTVTVGSTWSFNGSSFNVHPINQSGVTATHAITIEDTGGGDHSSAFQAVQVQNAVPASLWGSPPESGGNPQVPSGTDQTVAGQIVGVALNVLPPQIGGTAGPIDAATTLASDDLDLPGANLPLSNSAQPTGDQPVNGGTTVAAIANATTGIGAPSTITARNAIFTALGTAGYQPQTPNDPMTTFAQNAACAFAAEPLVVS